MLVAAVLAAAGGADLSTYAPLLVPAATGFVGWLAYLGVKRGNRVEQNQQNAKNKLDERVQTLAELQAVNKGLTEENTRLKADRDAAYTRHRDELTRATDACRRQLATLTGAIETLRTVVLDEVARAAAGEVVERTREHVERHDQVTPDGAP